MQCRYDLYSELRVFSQLYAPASIYCVTEYVTTHSQYMCLCLYVP